MHVSGYQCRGIFYKRHRLMDADAMFLTRSDLKELRQELRIEMAHLEHRLINKIGAIVIGTASVMMFLNNFFDRFN